MKGIDELAEFAGSVVPDHIDDAAFRLELTFLESDDDIAAFAGEFGVARGVVRGWKEGRFVPQPELRHAYAGWLRQHAMARLTQHVEREGSTGFALSAAQIAALARDRSQPR